MNDQPASSQFSRRKFIKTTAVSSAVLGFPAITHCKSPNGKLAVGMIGVGADGANSPSTMRNAGLLNIGEINLPIESR